MQTGAPEPGQARTRRLWLALIALSIVAFALLRLPFLSVPLERDEGEYAYIAQRMLAGDVPYRDAFDQKPPAVFLVYAAAFQLFGPTIESIHGFLHLWTAVTAGLLYRLVRRLGGPLPAAFALLAFAVVSMDPSLTATAANTEIFMLLPLVGSLLCLLRALESDGAGDWLGWGALAAAAFWFKPVAATQVVFGVLYAGIVMGRRRDLAQRIARGLGLTGIGAVALSLPVAVWFVRAGAWNEFLDSVFLHNIAYARRLDLAGGWMHLRYALVQQLPSFAAFWLLAAGALCLPRGAGRRWWPLLAGWLVASLLGVSTGLYFRSHYFVQYLPALATLVGFACASAARPLLAMESASLRRVGLAALVGLLLIPTLVAHRAYWGADPTRIARLTYGLNPFPEALTIGEYIQRTSEPEDSVYVVGSEPQIFFYAQRRSATRYIFFYPLTDAHPGVRERQREVLREVGESRPLYVVWAHVPTSTLLTDDTDDFIFRESAKLIQRAYRLEFIAWLDIGPALEDPAEAAGLEAGGFDFAYGEEAVQVLNAAIPEAPRHIWLAVYRRDG